MQHQLPQDYRWTLFQNVGADPKEKLVKVSWTSNSIKHPDKFIGAAGYAGMGELFQDGRG